MRLFFFDTWDNDLDLDVSARLVQASAQAYLSFGKEKGKVKAKARARADVLFAREDRRRRLKELRAKTECRACGRKGHWAHDRECAVSSRKIRHVQLVWRHDNIFLTNRIRLECVLFSTTTVMIPVHPSMWLIKTYLYQRNQPNRHL